MIRPGARVALFVALLAAVFAGAALAGATIGPEGDEGGHTTSPAGVAVAPAGVASAQGAYRLEDLPAPSRTATVDGYVVKLHERPGELGFVVRRGGKLVTDLQPHLVALRGGDLAFQHIEPDATPPPEIAFHTGAIQPGSYRLFLEFRHGGRVHTAAFTRRSNG